MVHIIFGGYFALGISCIACFKSLFIDWISEGKKSIPPLLALIDRLVLNAEVALDSAAPHKAATFILYC